MLKIYKNFLNSFLKLKSFTKDQWIDDFWVHEHSEKYVLAQRF